MTNYFNWYVEPFDIRAQTAFAIFLADTNGLAECTKIKLADGRKCLAFRLSSYAPIQKLKWARDKYGYQYQVYHQGGPFEPIRKWNIY